jgi:hypothetical protein
MIKVYFETPNHSFAELAATFSGTEAYEVCATPLHQLARKLGYVVTESHEEPE